MDADLYALVAKYGFKNLHSRLVDIMREEYTYLHSQFQTTSLPVKEVLLHEVPMAEKKPKKTYNKRPVAKHVETHETVDLSLENVELKDVIVTISDKPNQYRDPKDIKEFQKNAVEAKRVENEAVGFGPSHFLTKDNLKHWIEVEGRTYAWVAREKAGCPESQVAATAQMMGIKSKISKKRGIMMAGK